MEKNKLEAANFPSNIRVFLKEMLDRFAEADIKEYPAIDRHIGDVLHQVYKPSEGGSNEKLANKVF